MKTSMIFSVDTEGELTAIYSDDLVDLLSEGKATIQRASHVEPSEGGRDWTATMWNGIQLGPFKTRRDALSAEVAYLEKELFYGNSEIHQ